MVGLIQGAGYAFRVTGSTIFFLLNPQLLTRNGFHIDHYSNIPPFHYSIYGAKVLTSKVPLNFNKLWVCQDVSVALFGQCYKDIFDRWRDSVHLVDFNLLTFKEMI